jgi:hypothetical protein
LGEKPYKASDIGLLLQLVRSINFLVRFQKRGGGGGAMA